MFKKAIKKQVKLKIAMTGPSGSGKTKSALRLATGFGGRIALIDSENDSASLYADEFNFDSVSISAPYTTEKYIDAIKAAVKAGYDWVIVDSATHAWAGEGGLLDQKEQIDARGKGNSYTNWATITKKHEAFKAEIQNSPIHLIATMRSKQDYVVTENAKGKQAPQKVGLAPIQREGMEYEFTVVYDVAMNHEAEASKDRTGLYSGKLFKITEETGVELRNWLASGEQVKGNEPTVVKTQATEVKNPLKLADAPHNPIEETTIIAGRNSGKMFKDVKPVELKELLENINQKNPDRTKVKPASLKFIETLEAYLCSVELTNEEPPEMDLDEALA